MSRELKRKKFTIKGKPRYFDNEVSVTPGIEQTLHTETVMAGKKVLLYDLKVDSTTFGVFRVTKRPDGGDPGGGDDVLIGSGQTGPTMNNLMTWLNGRELVENEKFFIKYKSFTNSQPTLVRTHLLLSDK